MTSPGGLPPTVRTRLLALAGTALGSMPPEEVPPALRRIARFTPAKRASVAGNQLAAALEGDVFRASVSAVVRTSHGELAEAVAAGNPPAAADPAEVAALLWLLRPEGWQASLEQAVAQVLEQQRAGAGKSADEARERLEAELAQERAQRRAEAAELANQLAAARAEADRLGKDLRRANDRAARAESAARRAEEKAEQAQGEVERRLAEGEVELRRLRQRAVELEAAASAGKSSARRDRDVDTMRLRLLLDSVQRAVDGISRELALPPVTELRPADLLESGRTPAAAVTPSAQGRASDDPAFLSRLLAVPVTHLIVDGYNVTKTGYGAMSLEQQRTRLVSTLGGLAARTGVEVTVVFDGAEHSGPVVMPPSPRGVRVVFSDPGEIADLHIARLVGVEPPGRPLVVVSTDGEVAAHARDAGAHAVPSIALVRLLERG